jgi:hypothetical protein
MIALPNFNFNIEQGGSMERGGLGREVFDYSADFGSLMLGITGKKPTQKLFTGIERRPIPVSGSRKKRVIIKRKAKREAPMSSFNIKPITFKPLKFKL